MVIFVKLLTTSIKHQQCLLYVQLYDIFKMINLLSKKIKKKTQLSHLLLRHLASRRFTNVHNLSDCSENPGSCWALRIIENQWILSIQKVRYVSKIQRYTIKVLQCICALFKNLFMTDCFSLQSIKPLVLKPKEARRLLWKLIMLLWTQQCIFVTVLCAFVFMSNGFQSHCCL